MSTNYLTIQDNAFDELRLQARRKEETGGTCTLKKQDFYDILYQKEPEITKYTLDRNTTYPEVLADDEVYVYGDSLLAHDDIQVIGGKNASVVAEVDGSTTKHYSYSDYGESTNLNRHAYNGEVQDETGLIYLRARYYDPQTARFIQIDNHYAGEKQQVNTQNRYVYTLGNPYKYVDRDGKRAMMMDGGGSDDTNPYLYGFKEEWLSLSLLEFELRISKINAKARSTAKSMWNEYQRTATLYDENPPTDNQLERMINADQEPKTPLPNVDCNKNWFDHLVDGAKDVGGAIGNGLNVLWDAAKWVGHTVGSALQWISSNIDIILTGIAVIATIVGIVALAVAAAPVVVSGGLVAVTTVAFSSALNVAMVAATISQASLMAKSLLGMPYNEVDGVVGWANLLITIGASGLAAFQQAGGVYEVEKAKKLDYKLYENGGNVQTLYKGPKINPSIIDGKYKDLNSNYTLKGDYTYVLDKEGNLQMVESSKLGINGGHTSLTGGEPVQYAGTMHFNKSGQLTEWTNASGHYEPLVNQASTASQSLIRAGILDATMNKFVGFGR